MNIVEPAVHDYLDKILVVDHPILVEMEEYGRRLDFPIVGPQVGRLLNLLARSINAKRVLELGSGYGYSAMWFALGLGPGAQIMLTEGTRENSERAGEYFRRAGLTDCAVLQVGDALEIARRTSGSFDIVFNDVAKVDYPATLEIARARLRVGGYFICDNMLWSGRVIDGDGEQSTYGIKELTRQLMMARDFVTTILPIRDGVSVSLRLS